MLTKLSDKFEVLIPTMSTALFGSLFRIVIIQQNMVKIKLMTLKFKNQKKTLQYGCDYHV
ncbi:hypothetical protein T11_15066 [Trichinella zimbabwensis]|uniref:Uncharacterized protein n=1 Tax=Trichinella zimbabwensis TaxID=268475 RepID=A0A0V1HN24_9BILA|nr:hypothetical protein T11_15066 [Trichinella zimbabwensis]